MLSKVHAYLSANAVISRKRRGVSDVRRYINSGVFMSTSPRDGLLVIKNCSPFKPTSQRIVIPRDISSGLLTALHIQLNHPSTYQLKQVFVRAYFCLDLDRVARSVVDGCYTCAALKKVPTKFHEQSTSTPASIIGSRFSADVIRREKQFILLMRESISSFTDAVIIPNETADSLRDGIILLASRMRSPVSPHAVIRTDPASALRSLVNSTALSKMNLQIELGDAKNINKNPIAEKAIEELHAEIVRFQPLGGRLSPTSLAQAVSTLNSRIRHNNLSAAEIWTQRDMSSGMQLSMDDSKLIEDKYRMRLAGHAPSAKSKAHGREKEAYPELVVGDIIFLYSDRDKTRGRDKYMVMQRPSETHVMIQKLVNKQFRGRSYSVKLSDVIVVPKKEPSRISHGNCNDYSDVSTPSPVPKNKCPSLQSPIVHLNPDDSDSSTDSDDDWVMPHTVDVPQVAIAQQPVNPLPQQIVQQQPLSRRPRRNVRPPVHLRDYQLASLEPLPGDDDINDPLWLQAEDVHGAGHRAGDAQRDAE